MTRFPLAALVLSLAAARAVTAQEAPVSAPVTGMRYEVSAMRAQLAQRMLGVSTSFDVGSSAPVLLSLPAWTPGAYEIGNFARNVSEFAAKQDGVELQWDKVDKDTWRVRPSKGGRVTVTFDYAADSLDNAMAWAKPDFVLFNGTNLFMYPEGRPLDFAASVAIRTEKEFLVATSMSSTGAHAYRAANYHDLVDMPVFVGVFDLDSARISGKTVRYATYPAGSVHTQARTEAWDQLKRIIPVESSVFGETPWDSYTLMQIADTTYGGYSGLEHSASHVDIVAPGFIGSDAQPSLYAHEIFHSWNVKRLRPADLVPYRYDREQPTTWLWVSEGITDYYADLAMMRAGIVDQAGFMALTAAKMAEIAATAPFAVEDASLNTWMHPTDGTEYSYYPKGSLLGFMLDIAIRDASDNKRSLDAVMRELYDATYKKGRGFTHDDFWGAVKRASNGKDYTEFERMFVDGRDPLPWVSTLASAGLRLVPDSTPRIGVSTALDPQGDVRVMEVTPGSAAASAGVLVGDALVKVGEVDVKDGDFGAKLRLQYAGRQAGSPLPIVVKRGTGTLTLPGVLAYVAGTPRIIEDPDAPPKAVRVRSGILRGTVDR
ncbi:MAG: hypothetical protein ABIY52_12050 [Gemmatimonadaceae bacterium]